MVHRSDEKCPRALGITIRQPIQLLFDNVERKHEQIDHGTVREPEREESCRELHGAVIRGNAHKLGIR